MTFRLHPLARPQQPPVPQPPVPRAARRPMVPRIAATIGAALISATLISAATMLAATISAAAMFAAILAAPRSAAGQQGGSTARVELELVTDRGFPVTGQQEWLSFLRPLDIDDLRIRTGRPGDEIGIESRETGGSVRHRVVGMLVSGNRLQLPGGTFRYGDRSGISAWLTKLRKGGEENVYARREVFGLTEKQLVRLHEQLAAPVAIETRGQPVADVVRKISDSLPVRTTVERSATAALSGRELVADELKGMASGTALVAAIRPLGLVLVPSESRAGEVQVRIVDVREVRESWPLGWPTQKAPGNLVPKLFKRLNVEIADIPLREAVDAIQGRLEIPVLYDYNSLARRDIDLQRARVSLPAGNTYYKEILDQLLRQAELKSELRVDDAGKPLMWISPR